MKVENGKVLVEAYDQGGKHIGTVPNESTSNAFSTALESTFARTISPDPDGIVAVISNPTSVKTL